MKPFSSAVLRPAIFIFLLTSLFVGCANQDANYRANRDAADPVSAQQGMVVTANPLATQAGLDVLRAGGSAVDAAVAIEAVLSLVEPQSSGLAGGAFMVYYHQDSGEVITFDGRERAPASAQAGRFLQADGSKMGFLEAKHSGLSTGVPGVVAMLNLAHQEFGTLPWSQLFAAARQHAEQGFAVSPRLQGMIERFGKYLPSDPAQGDVSAFRYLHNADGSPLEVGHILKNPEYVQTLDLLAQGADKFYQGLLAEKIVAKVNEAPHAGSMSLPDLRDYSAERRVALCTDYRDLSLCGPHPPSSWVAVAMTMGILAASDGFSERGAADPANWALFAEAQRLAYADRDQFVADAEQVIVPISGLLHPDYLALRASQISATQAQQHVEAGDPWAFGDSVPQARGADATVDAAGTTHFVVVDQQGNVVSMTASVESIFGSARMVGGMFLNNQLTDFSFLPEDENGEEIANAVAAGKRPRSSMSPTIVLDQAGNFKLATGSPGGNSIIAYTLKTLVGVLDWGLTPQQAVNLPNLVARGDTVRVEKERAPQALIDGLRAHGFALKESEGENSGLSVVYVDDVGQLLGGVDPRREGTIGNVD